MLSKIEFLKKIKKGEYNHYEIQEIKGKKTSVSKKDGLDFNNFG